MIGSGGMGMECGDGALDDGAIAHYAPQIGDVYDDISQFHVAAYNLIQSFTGKPLSPQSGTQLESAFQNVEAAQGSDNVFSAVSQAHQTAYNILAYELGRQPTADQGGKLENLFQQLDGIVSSGKSLAGQIGNGLVHIAAVAAPIVLGAVGSIIPGLGTVAGIAVGTALGGAIGGAASAGLEAGVHFDTSAGGGTYTAPPPAPTPPNSILALAKAASTSPARFATPLSGKQVLAGVSMSGGPAVDRLPPPSTGGARPLALAAPSSSTSTVKTVLGVGALATVAVLAWRRLM